MFPHGLTSAGHVAAWRASDPAGSDRGASIAWTGVHAITRSNTCLNYILSEMIAGLTFRHVDTSWASDLHQMKIAWSRSNGLQWSRVELSSASDFHHYQSSIGRQTEHDRELERDWSRIPPWFHRIFPLNTESPWERIRANSLQFAQIGA